MPLPQTFPELGILKAYRGRRSRGHSQYDVCAGSGRKTTHRGGTRTRCEKCRRMVRVTSLGNLPTHMRTVEGKA